MRDRGIETSTFNFSKMISKILFLLAALAIATEARYVLQEVWVYSAVVSGPYCHGTPSRPSPPPDYVIFTPLGVCQAHNVRETFTTGDPFYAVMYTYTNHKLRLHYYSDAECTNQTSSSLLSTSPTGCKHIATENSRYLGDFSYVRFAIKDAITSFYSNYTYSITVYDSTKPKCKSKDLLFNIQESPFTCILGSRSGPYRTNGLCSPTSTAVNVSYCRGDDTCKSSSCTFEQIDTADNVCRLGDNLDRVVGGVDRSEIVSCKAPSS